ncbi:hypothetical protein ISN45_Aa08g003950 [Arabidopsis thaliana x Arabidopsis arenosa]|uniref:Transmembrane protein n=1 Tax=Arabidopsis thaliana x Arabidopsis arenosa TaxID=1240361 RepID=A0A8T1XES2_9BRAS|nr:hypothetical protein ISN45_Aa08g003950 [Arabidopsis thaliana x Arabidopsis arenosa]
MGKKFSSQLRQMLVLVMLLIVFPCLSQSAPLSATGRRLSIYFPNAGIRAGPSKSGQGGGRIPVAAP